MSPVRHRLLVQTVCATLVLGFVACTDADNPMRPAVRALFTTPTGLVTANPPQIFTGAGDIASCSNTGDEATAKLLDAIPQGTVYNIGDDAYDNGTPAEFQCYDATWGRHKARTKPSAGNHEYNTSGATGYYGYFGAVAQGPDYAKGTNGQGYYSYDLGLWHIIVLNSNITRTVGSLQDTWLANDLAAHPNQCTLAYWHHPLYSSTGGSGSGGVSIASMQPFWNRLYAAHADLVLNGHRHFYERLKPMKPDGSSDPTNGITEIIAGTGGIGGGSETNLFPLHVTGDGATFGVLKLYLYDDSFAWKFIPVAGKTYTDSGSTACHSSGGGGGGGGGGVSATNSTISATPTSFTAGTGSSQILVTALDGSNNPVSGQSVTLASTGSSNTFTPGSGTTDGNGQFTSTFTSTVAEGKTISANIGGTPINATASVTVNPSGGGGGGSGTIVQTLLTTATNAANQTVYTTASIAPAANALVTVAVLGRRSSGALTPTISGGGIGTWVQVASVDYDPISTPASRLVVFRGMSTSPGSGAITITFSSSMSNATWMVSQWSGVDQTGTNGSGAIGQTATTAGDAVGSLASALGVFGSASNVGFGVIGVSANAPFVTPGAGSTEIGETGSGESTDLETQSGVNDNTIAATFSSGKNAGLLAIELKAGGGGAPAVSATNSTITASSPIAAGGSSTIDVVVKDGSNNPMSGVNVTLSSTGGTITPPSAATDGTGHTSGSLSATAAGSYTVTAVAGGVTLSTKPVVVVNPGSASALAFVAQPSNTQANAPIAPAVVVEVQDQYGNRVNSSANVAMAFGTNAGSGTLSGTLTQAAVNGDATFSDLAIDKTASGYTLSASSSGLTGITSSTFNITQPAPSATLSLVSAGTPTFAAGGSSGISVVVKDGLGNGLAGATVTLSSSVAGDVITQPVGTTDGGGNISGSVSATSAGPRTITAVAGSTTLNQKPGLTVTAGPADAGKSSVGASPASIAAGSGTSTITVTVNDQYGNPVSGSSVSLSTSGTNFTLTQPAGSTGSNGVTTGTLSSTDPQVFTVSAMAGAVGIAQTASVTVTSAPPPGIVHSLLTSGHDPTNASTYTTASIAPAANALVTVAVLSHQASAAVPDPIVTGAGMTWQVVASVAYDGATPLDRLTIYRAMSATPGSGPLTIKTSATVSNCQWIVSQWTGASQSGTNGSGAIVQTNSATGAAVTTLSPTLAAFPSTNDVAYGVFGIAQNTAAATAGGGFTTIDQQPSGESSVGDLLAEWAVNLPAVTATWPSKPAGALSVEIKAGP